MLIEVGREVLYEQGSFSTVRVWYAGWVPNIGGLFVRGWSGERQTIVIEDRIYPVVIFTVLEKALKKAA